MAHSYPLKEDHWVLFFDYVFIPKVTDSVMFLAFCLQAVTQTPQHFRGSRRKATQVGYFASISSFIRGSHNHCFDKSTSVVHYLCVSMPPAVLFFFFFQKIRHGILKRYNDLLNVCCAYEGEKGTDKVCICSLLTWKY